VGRSLPADPNIMDLLQGEHPEIWARDPLPVDLSVGDIRSQTAAEWLQIAQWSLWRAYRKLLSLFRMVPSLIPYDKILRILQKKGRCCNDCLYRQYDTLPPCQLFNYQVLRFVHTVVYLPHLVSMIFHNYFTLSTSVHNYSTRHNKLYLSHVSSLSGGRLLNFKGSQLWNRLPKYLINIKSHQLFKKLRYYVAYNPL